MTRSRAMMPAEAAASVLMWLESRGAIITLDDEDYFWVDMNPISQWDGDATPELMANTVLSLRDEIRQILIARRRQVFH